MSTARLGPLKLYPLADESMGVRSMAIGVDTGDLRIVFDAGVSLAPLRYGLPPHPEEFRAVRDARERIMRFGESADVITVSHYHLDHYTPSFTSYYEWSGPDVFEELYAGKTLIVKNPETSLSFNQRKRASVFLRQLQELNVRVIRGDAAQLAVGGTKLSSIGVFPHGAEDLMGGVLCFMVEHEGFRLIYAPDVQGPPSVEALKAILAASPDVVIVGGPPTYLSEYKVPADMVEAGLHNLRELAETVPVIVSHHLLRDAAWREKVRCPGLTTYAELAGLKPRYLEAWRRELYAKSPVDAAFSRWLREYRAGSRDPPPI